MLVGSRTTAIVAIAAALTLGGCGTSWVQAGGEDASNARETRSPAPTPGDAGAESDAGSSPDDPHARSGAGSSPEEQDADADGASPDSGGDPDDLWADKAKTRSWASDASIDVDADGNGSIPAAALEADLVDLFANKFGLKVKEARCDQDMEVRNWEGFESCDVVAEDMTYFGTVELVDHKDAMIEYEVMFPGIDEKDLDLGG